MNADILSALVNLGSSGAVIIVVVYFLKFIDGQIKSLNDQRQADQEPIRNLVNEVKTLTQELVNLRKDFDVAVAAMRERTQSRSRTTRKADS
jgi:cell division protein FtsB